MKHSIRNLTESPNSCASTFRTASTRSGSRSGSTCQVINEWIMPNVHKAIMTLLLDWINICPNDFQQVAFRRELIDFLNRVSLMGEQYRYVCDEIRFLALINVSVSNELSLTSLINLMLQKIIDFLHRYSVCKLFFKRKLGKRKRHRTAIYWFTNKQGIWIGKIWYIVLSILCIEGDLMMKVKRWEDQRE